MTSNDRLPRHDKHSATNSYVIHRTREDVSLKNLAISVDVGHESAATSVCGDEVRLLEKGSDLRKFELGWKRTMLAGDTGRAGNYWCNSIVAGLQSTVEIASNGDEQISKL